MEHSMGEWEKREVGLEREVGATFGGLWAPVKGLAPYSGASGAFCFGLVVF